MLHIRKLSALALVLFNILGCGRDEHISPQARAEQLVLEYNALNAEVDEAIASFTDKTTHSELATFDAKIDRLISLCDELIRIGGKNGIETGISQFHRDQLELKKSSVQVKMEKTKG